MDIETINRDAGKFGWRIAKRKHDIKWNPVGLADWYIERLGNEVMALDRLEPWQDATHFVVEQAWTEGGRGIPYGENNGGVHSVALDFLKANAPESYVQAIKIAHDCE